MLKVVFCTAVVPNEGVKPSVCRSVIPFAEPEVPPKQIKVPQILMTGVMQLNLFFLTRHQDIQSLGKTLATARRNSIIKPPEG